VIWPEAAHSKRVPVLQRQQRIEAVGQLSSLQHQFVPMVRPDTPGQAQLLISNPRHVAVGVITVLVFHNA